MEATARTSSSSDNRPICFQPRRENRVTGDLLGLQRRQAGSVTRGKTAQSNRHSPTRRVARSDGRSEEDKVRARNSNRSEIDSSDGSGHGRPLPGGTGEDPLHNFTYIWVPFQEVTQLCLNWSGQFTSLVNSVPPCMYAYAIGIFRPKFLSV